MISLSVLYAKEKKTYPTYVSKYSSNPEKNYSFNDFKQSRIALLIAITLKHQVIYCLYYLHSFRTKKQSLIT